MGKKPEVMVPLIHIAYTGPETSAAAHLVLNELIAQGYVVVHWNMPKESDDG